MENLERRRMKKEEKKELFNLLKTIDASNEGYQRECFKTEPEFEDDVEIEAEAPETIVTQEEQTVSPAATDNAGTSSETPPSPQGLTLQTLTDKIKKCTRCDLCQSKIHIVYGDGVSNPDVLVIGDCPDYDADIKGYPAVGKAGELLDKMLMAIKLDRKTNCYITNIIKCRPPQDREPSSEEKDACFSFLEAQIKVLKPKMLLCLGRIAAQTILDSEDSMSNMHGNFYEYNKIPLMVTYHPNALLKNAELKKPAWDDLKKFRSKLDEISK